MSAKVKNTYENLGKMLAGLRQKAGIAQQAELASLIKSTQQTVSRWELGLSRPRYNQMPLLAATLKADLNALLQAAGYTPKTTVATFDQPFPIDALDPDSFERFCLHYLQALYPTAKVHRYGGTGHTQDGLDVEVIFTDKTVYTFQCKRVDTFGPAKVHAAVKAHTRKAKKKFILLTRVASPDARDAIRKHSGWDIWDKEDVSRSIRQDLVKSEQIRLVDIFFRGQRLALLGETEPSPWQTLEEFFAPFTSGRGAFSHAWELVGRTEETQALVQGLQNTGMQAIFLIGAGGAGKSRILKQAIETYHSAHRDTLIRFLSPTEEVSSKSLDDLGNRKKLLVIDDAHDRNDLLRLFQYASILSNNTTILLAFRPYGLDLIKAQASNFSLSADRTKIVKLSSLSLEQATQLALQVLKKFEGPESAAKDIAKLTQDCPLATVIGAQIVAKEKVHYLELIKNADDFRTALLGKFRKIIAGDIGKKNDEEAIQKLLKILSLLQPFHPEDEAIKKIIEQVEGVRPADSSRLIRLLTDAGVLFKRGGQYRLSPDALADYIIEEACIGAGGISTGYAEQVFDVANPTHIENLLLNLGKLDWRLANGNPSNSRLLDGIWNKLRPSSEYADPHIRAVTAVAYYQPKRTLDFAIRLIHEGKYLRDLPELLKYTAYSLEHLPQACLCLWELGKNDNRTLNQHPGHAIRILSELGAVEPRKPIAYNEAIVDFGIELTKQAGIWDYAFTPFDILKGILQTEGHTTTSNKRSITLHPFIVPASFVSELRNKVINATLDLLSHQNPKIGVLAANFLQEGLRYPRGMGGLSASAQEREAWTKEFILTLKEIDKIIRTKNLDSLVLIALVRSVSWHANYANGETTPYAKRIVAALPKTLEFQTILALVDGYGHLLERLDFKKQQREWDKFLKTLTETLIATYPDGEKLRAFIEESLSHILNNHASTNTSSHILYWNLIQASSALAHATVADALKNPESKTVRFVDMALASILSENHTLGLNIASEFFVSQSDTLQAAIGHAYARLNPDAIKYGDEDFTILQSLLASKSQWVVYGAVNAVRVLAKTDARQAIELLKNVDLGNSSKVTDEVFGLFQEMALPFQLLTESDIKVFLDNLEPLAELEGHWIETFLANASEHCALLTANFFMQRVEHAIKTKDWNYRPCNHGPYNYIPLRFRESSEFSSLLRQISLWMTTFEKDDYLFKQRAGELFQAMFSPFDDELVGFLQSWMDSATVEDLSLICQILTEAPTDFVFIHRAFVMKLLERAKQLGKESLDEAIGAFYRSATQGMKSGAHGEPFPEDIQLKEGAEKVLSEISPFSPAHRLYDDLKKHAERNIAFSFKEREALEE